MATLQNTLIPSGAPRVPSSTTATSSRSSGSLRDRCGVTFKITAVVYGHTPIIPKGALEPHVDNLPRRKKRISTCLKPTQKIEVSCLQELAPGLSVAFVDDPCDGYFMKSEDRNLGTPLKSFVTNDFTHVLNIVTGDQSGTVSQSVDSKTGAKKLHLVVPFSTTDDGVTHLTPSQLLAARDFLTTSVSLDCSPTDNILITTPRDRPVDAISVAASCLAVSTGTTVESVLEHVNEDEGVLGIWKGVVSRDGIEVVANSAKAE